MRYSFISATLLAITSFASAQTTGFDAITAPTQGQVATVGSTLDIIWEPEDVTGTITITLLEGSSSSTLQLGDAIATGIDNQAGKYSWSIPSTIGSFATYGFKISLDATPETFQYSFPFQITGTSGSSSSASASATGSVTSTMTVKLTMGTVSSTASVTMTSSAANSTTTLAPTAASNATLESAVTASASSNISTTLSKNTVTSTATKTSGSSSSASSTSTAASTATANAAISNVATGSLALIGGLLMAFAL